MSQKNVKSKRFELLIELKSIIQEIKYYTNRLVWILTNRRYKVIALVGIIFYFSLCIINKYPEYKWLGQGIAVSSLTFLIIDLVWHQYIFTKLQFANKINFETWLKKARRVNRIVRIHSTFSYLLDCEKQQNYWGDFQRLLITLLEKKSVRIQILLINPNSEIAKKRNEERNDEILNSIFLNLSSLYSFLTTIINEDVRKNVDVRIYDRLPGLQLHQLDDEVSVSYFPPEKAASEVNRMLYNVNTDPAEFHLNWFKETWKDQKRTIPLDYFMKCEIKIHNENGKFHQDKMRYVILEDGDFYIILDKDEYNEVEGYQESSGIKIEFYKIECLRALFDADRNRSILRFINYDQSYLLPESSGDMQRVRNSADKKYGKKGISYKVIQLIK